MGLRFLQHRDPQRTGEIRLNSKVTSIYKQGNLHISLFEYKRVARDLELQSSATFIALMPNLTRKFISS